MDETRQSDLLPETTRYLDYFLALTEVAKTLTASLERTDVLNAIMQHMTSLLRPSDWSLLLVDQDTDELYFEIVVGDSADALRGMRLKMGEGIAGWVASHGESVVCPKVADDPRFSSKADEASSFQTASIVCVPLICREEVLGVIELVKDSSDGEPFNDSVLAILAPFADFAAIAIDNARSFSRVQELTIRDEWTGLHNARFLERYLSDEINRADRYKGVLSLVFFDLDYFKQVNDTFGHAVGSGTLRAVGQVVEQLIRKTDRAVRYGGDEFVIVLTDTDRGGALFFAERVREHLALGGLEEQVGEPVKVTASFGVASFPEDGEDAATLLQAADRAMYAAKAAGRNTVRSARDV